MKRVLIATQEKYIPFIMTVIEPYDSSDFVFINTRSPTSDWLDLDIGISFMWTSKIEKHELESTTWFNFHPAPLPEYKGRNLCYHAIMNGETEFGATVHYMDENFDTGDIIHVHRFEIYKHDTAGTISRDAIHICKALFQEYFPRIIAGEQFERLPNVGGTYYKKEAIIDTVTLTEGEPFGQFVRAVTCGDFYPKVDIGGVKYKIVRDE